MGMDFPSPATNGMVYAPSGGPEYVFSNGAWVQVEGVSGPISGATFFDSKAQAQASFIAPLPGGPASITLLGYYGPNDGGGAGYNRVSAPPVSPLADFAAHTGWFQSADGAYWELAVQGEVTLEMFGGRGDGKSGSINVPPTGTDNWPAMQGALSYGWANMFAGTRPAYGSTCAIRILRGKYLFSQMTDIRFSTRISGIGGAPMGNAQPASIMLFPLNTSAFRFWGHAHVDPEDPTGLSYSLSYGSIFENIRLEGLGGYASYPNKPDGSHIDGGDPTKHGIIMYTTIQMRQITASNFAGSGVFVQAFASGPNFGSANELDFYAIRCSSNGCHGLYVEGDNSNAGNCIRIDGTGNGGYGWWDGAVAGNTWTGGHCSDNNWKGRVNHNGWQWLCQHHTLGGATEPGTEGIDPLVWTAEKEGGRDAWHPDWKEGNRYIPGGAFCTTRPGGATTGSGTVVVGNYIEGLQGQVKLSTDTIVIGGSNTFTVRKTPGLVISGVGAQQSFGARNSIANSGRVGVQVTLGNTDLEPIKLNGETDVGSGYAIGRWNDQTQTYDFRYNNSDLTAPISLTTLGTMYPANAGRGAGISGGSVIFPKALFVGSTLANARLLSNNPSIPTIGPEYGQGDISFNTAAGIGNNAAWVCTQPGVVSTTAAWVPGTQHAANSVMSYNGKHYRVALDPSGKSIWEPHHSAGDVAYEDGYTWRFQGDLATVQDWVGGTPYSLGDYTINLANTVIKVTVLTQPWASKNYTTATGSNEAIAPNGRRYRCTIKGPSVSTVPPSHVTSQSELTIVADGYRWKDLGFAPLSNEWESKTYAVNDEVGNTTNFRRYRCVIAGTGDSLVSPAHATTPLVQAYPADGYSWSDQGVFCSTVHPAPDWPRPGGVNLGTDGYSWEYQFNKDSTPFWRRGRVYHTVRSSEENHLVQTVDGKGYKPTATGPSTPTTIAPRHDKTVTGPDGYGWTFMDSGTIVAPGDVNWALNATHSVGSIYRSVKGYFGAIYPVGQELTSYNGALYRCVKAPASASSNAPIHTRMYEEVTEEDGYRWQHLGDPTVPVWISQNYPVNYELTSTNGFLYRSTIDPGTSVSTVPPTHTNTAGVTESDGYGWKYLGNPSSPLWVSKDYAIGAEVLAGGRLYRCTFDPGGVSSVNAPKHFTGEVDEADGYRWLYVYRSIGGNYKCAVAPGTNKVINEPVHLFGTVASPTVPLGGDGYTWAHEIVSWATGTNYAVANRVVASNGICYECSADPAAPALSTVEPTHLSGAVRNQGATSLAPVHLSGTLVTGRSVKEPDQTGVLEEVTETDGYRWQHQATTTGAAWVTATVYAVNDIRKASNGHDYKVVIAPVSDGYEWMYLATAAGTAWVANTVYTVGDVRKNALHDYQLVSRPAGDGYGWTRLEEKWASGTNYPLGAKIGTAAGRFYQCTVDPGGVELSVIEPVHLSGEVINTPAPPGDGYGWTLINGPLPMDIWPLWVSGTNYVAGINVTGLDGKRYRLTEDGPAGVVSTVPPERPLWVTGTNYALGDRRVASNGILYECTTDPATGNSIAEPIHTSGAFIKATNVAGGDGYGWTVIGDSAKQIVGSDSYGWTLIRPWVVNGRYISQEIVVAPNSRTYKSTTAPPAQLSTIKPTHSDRLLYSDGYIWHHLNSTYVAWSAFGEVMNQLDISTNEALTLIPQTTPREVRHTGTLSANRIVTLDKTLAYDGMRYRICRTGGNINGVWTLNIGNPLLATLRTGDWCDVTFDTTSNSWYLSAFGQLIDVRNQQTIIDELDFTLLPNVSPQETLHTGTLTSDVAVTLSVTSAFAGQVFRIARTGPGAFLIKVGTLVSLRQGDWAMFTFDGTAWYLSAFGLREGQQTVVAVTDFIFTPSYAAPITEVLFTGVMTGNRQVALATTGVLAGTRARFSRLGLGTNTFSFAIGSLFKLANEKWCEIVFDGTQWYLAGSGDLVNSVSASLSHNPASIAAGAVGAVTTISLPGAVLGDPVNMSFSLDQAGTRLEGWVSAADVVSFRFANPTGLAIDLGAGVVRARLMQYMTGVQPTATAVYDPPSMAAAAIDADQTLTVTGAAFGDGVTMSTTVDQAAARLDAWVSAVNTVKFRFSNPTTGTIDVTSGTVRARLVRGTAFPEASVIYAPPSLAAGELGVIQTLDFPGALLGDGVEMSFSLDLQGVRLGGWVSENGIVSFRFHNTTAGVVPLLSGTVKARLVK